MPARECGRRVPGDHNEAVAFTRDDRRIIIFTGGLVVIAALFFVSVLVFATGGSTPSKKNTGPLYLGEASGLRDALDEGSPLYFANPFGGAGFWFDREDGDFVALDVRVPNSTSCNVKWIGRSTNAYVDCNGDHLQSEELARYPVEVGQKGKRKGSVFVDLKHREPPPTQSSASG
jgi:hypothetical protein